MLPSGMDWIKTLDPLKQVVKQDEIDIAVQKLSLLRALGPKAITGDIANLMSQVINASGGNVRRTVVLTFPLVVDKLLEFVDHWAVKVNSVISSPATTKEDASSKAAAGAGSFQIVQSEWQNYDDVERERMIPLLQTELKSLREMYQERVDEINSFESRMEQIHDQAKKEALRLQKQLNAVQEEFDLYKVSVTAKQEVLSVASPKLESDETLQQNETIQHLQQDIQGLHDEIKHLLKEKDLLVQSATQLEEELHGTIMAKEKLTQQLGDYKRQNEQIPQLETMLTMSNQQKLQLETQLKKAETAVKNQEKIVETLAKNLQKKEKEVQRLIAQLDTAQQQLRKTEESLNNLSNEHVALEAAAQGLHRSIAELQECKEVLTKSQEELQRKVFALENDLVKSRVENQNLKDDFQSMTNEKDMLLMALEGSQMKLREKIEELELIEAQKTPTNTVTPAAIQHLQQGIVGGVGNIVDYFEQRASSAGTVSPVPGDSTTGGAAGAGAASGRPAFPLLKRLSTGISSLTQGNNVSVNHNIHNTTNNQTSLASTDDGGNMYDPAAAAAQQTSSGLHQSYPMRNNYNSNSGNVNNIHSSSPGLIGSVGGVNNGVNSKSHSLAASIRSKYSTNAGNNNTENTTSVMGFDANNEPDDDPSYYAPVPSTRDIDSDDEA